jgi:hypothetical protein
MSAAKTLPFHAGCAARLHMRDGAHGYTIIIAATEAQATPEALLRPGEVSALLSHDRGVSWPDAKGQAMARGVLAAGGMVALGFATLADALACQQRIRAEK